MSDFRLALDSFLAGTLDFAGLEAALAAALQANPAAAPEIAKLIDDTYHAGRLPPPLYSLLKSRIATAGAQPAPPPQQPPPAAEQPRVPVPPVDEGADRTQIRPPPQAPRAPETGADKTVMRPPPVPGAPAGEATPPPAPPPEVTTPTGVPTSPTDLTTPTGRPTSPTDVTSRTGPPTTPTGRAVTGTAPTGATSDSSWGEVTQLSPEQTEVLEPGSVLKGRFVLEEVIGRGGMGEVFKARDLRKEEAQDRNPHIAVKVLNESFKAHPESLKALQREARKAQNLAHPNVVNVFDFDRDGGNVYMTMEFLVGEPLDKLIKKQRGHGLKEDEALSLVRDMGQALAYAHKHGVVHSDFKPGNAFLTQEGVVKVFDFGIARASTHAAQGQGEKTLFDAGQLGALTPAYASYEMLEGDEPDERDDIYALACVAYELLTGRHPFDKLPANQALQKKLVAKPVKGLSRSQWKGLLRGLAFKREDRSPSVEAFLSDISRKRINKGVLMGGVAAVLLVVVLLGILLPDYLHKRRIAALVERLKSAESPTVVDALARVETLEPDDQKEVIQEAKDELIAWYEGQIDQAIDEGRGRYDYPEAERVAAGALKLYPDSARIQNLKERIESRKNQLLNELNTRFNQHLAEGRLLPSEQDDINDVLTVLAQVSPDHALLRDPRLPAAYAEQAARSFEAGELQRSSQLLVAGLERYPQDVNLVNLQDRVKAELLREERELRVAELKEQLGTALPSLSSLAAVDGVRDPVLELKELQADAELVSKIQVVTRELLDKEIDARIAEREWASGFTLLQDYSDLADGGDYLQSRHGRITTAQQDYQQKVDSVYAALLEAVSKRRLDAPSKGSAQKQLAELEGLGAEPSLVAQGRAAIGQGFLELAREARAKSQWEEARTLVQQGLQQQPGDAMVASLQAESTEIGRAEQAAQAQLAEAEREAREKERQARIQEFRLAFEQSLAAADYDAESAKQSLKNLDQLAAVSPADPLVTEGRTQVAERLTQRVTALSGAGEWEQALALARQSVAVIPGSELLSTTLLDIERGRAQQLAQQREQTIEQSRQALAGRLAEPGFDDKWEAAVRGDLKMLAGLLPAEDPWLVEQRQAISTLYLGKARDMRNSQRFSEAAALLKRGEKFAPDTAAYQQERTILAEEEARFNEENKEKLRLARIEGNKQTLLTQAKANDVRNAKKTLDALHAELPENDPFVANIAPNAIGSAYLRLAESSAKKRKYEAALKLIRAGSAIAPGLSSLQEAQERYEREIRVGKVRSQLASAKVLDVGKVRQALKEIKADEAVDYAKVEKEFGGVLVKRVNALAKENFPAAEKLLAASKELFPAHAKLAALTIKPTKVEPKPAPPPVVKPAPDKPKPPTYAPTPTARGKECRPALAGYGSRARGVCYDMLLDDLKGPLMVVVPAGGGNAQPYAISKYEISVSDYNHYCKVSGQCKGVRASSGELPVTGISIKNAQAYASWMSKHTGYNYRIPTEQEWAHAANAQGKQPGKDFNCRVLLGSQVIKGQALGSVKMGKANGWGLKNYVGNAQEWVKTPGGFAARGGAFPDSLSKCAVSLSKKHDGQPDELTSFRLVREVKTGG